MLNQDQQNNKSSKYSNLKHLFGLIASMKVANYFSLPQSLQGMAQMGLEDLWDGLLDIGGNIGNTATNITSINFNISSQHLFGDKWELDGIYEVVLYIFGVLILYYCFGYVWAWSKFLGITDNYYTSALRKYYYHQLLNQHTSIVATAQEQIDIVNNHLVVNKLFINDYGRDKYYQHKYHSIPNDGAHNLRYYAQVVLPALHIRYYFNDTELNTHGYIYWTPRMLNISVPKKSSKESERGSSTITEDIIVNTEIPILTVVCNRDIEDYLEQISIKKREAIYTMSLFYIHLNKGKSSEHIFCKTMSKITYKGNYIDYFREHYAEKAEKQFIDPFFHPIKADLWKKLRTIHFEPEKIVELGQYPQSIQCLYGPPGTGKSSFAYRVARALGRHVISINLAGVKSKLELHQILYGCNIMLPNTSPLIPGLNWEIEPKSVVYVLDEFDQAIVTLQARTEIKAKRKERQMSYINNFFGGLDMVSHIGPLPQRSYMGASHYQGIYDSDSELDFLKVSSDSAEENLNTDCDNTNDKDKADHKQKTKKAKCIKKRLKDKQAVHNRKKEEKENEISKLIDDMGDSDDDLTVDSLLTTIQSACSNNGAIVFAMTNMYQKIKKISPRLFRVGRFKPYHFGYPTRCTINDMTMYYYDRDIMGTEYDYIPDIIRISTSRLAIRCVDSKFCRDTVEEQFEYFIEHLKYDLEHHTLNKEFEEYEEIGETDMISLDSGISSNSPLTKDNPLDSADKADPVVPV